MQRRRRWHYGVTLMECLISLVVLAIGVVAAVQCLNMAMAMNLKNNRVAMATTIARGTFDDVFGQSVDGYKENMAELPGAKITTSGTTWTGEVPLTPPVDDEQYDPNDDRQKSVFFPQGSKRVVIAPRTGDATEVQGKLFVVTVTISWQSGQGRQDVTVSGLSTNATL